MRIGSSERRLTAKIMGVGLLVDVVVAFAIARFAVGQDDLLLNTAIIWAVMQVAAIALTILGLIRLAVANKLGAFRPAKDGFLTALETNNFPLPGPYENTVDSYLESVAENSELEKRTNLAAATLIGVRLGIRGNAGLVKTMMIDNAHEEALKAYRP
jgi:hypothetical protein